MRILTVRQPWAWAIIHGGKNIENRTTNIAGDYRGPVAIHAAKATDLDGFKHPEIVGRVAMTKLFDPPDLWFSNSPTGAILGVVDLVGVHYNGTQAERWDFEVERNTTCSPWADHGPIWHLELSNPRPLTDPIPYTGALGLRRLDADIVTQIMEGLEQ